MELLKFSKGMDNTKLKKIPKEYYKGGKHYSISLTSGDSCPYRYDCGSRIIDGKIVDDKNMVHRCYAIGMEFIYKNTHKQRKHNFDIVRKIKDLDLMVETLQTGLDTNAKNCKLLRIHVGGDMYSQLYFDSFIALAKQNPHITMYAYTKSLPYWIARINDIPDNLSLTASRGGRRDDLIDIYKLKEAIVVYSEQEAYDLGLEIDTDDTHAIKNDNKSFALLIHGPQPKGFYKSIKTKKQLLTV